MPTDFTKSSITTDFAKTVAGGALAEDVEGDAIYANTTPSSGTYYKQSVNCANGAEVTLATVNLVFDATSLAFAAGFISASSGGGNSHRLRLYMGGVLMQSGVFLPTFDHSLTSAVRDFKALAGAQACVLTSYNDSVGWSFLYFYGGDSTSQCPAALAVGSVKLG